MKIAKVSLIASHGHIIHHLPEPRREGRFSVRSTLQIAEPSIIAERTGLTVAADFRPGGILQQAARARSLTPYLHYILLISRGSPVLLLISAGSAILPISLIGIFERIAAFDTRPGKYAHRRLNT